MTRSIAHFNLWPFHGSPYDLWYPSERGVRTGPSKVRPKRTDTEKFWPRHALDYSKTRELNKAIAEKYNLVIDEGGFLIADLDSGQFPDLVSELAQLHRDQLVFPANGFLRIKWIDSATEPAEWFEYEPKGGLSHINTDTNDIFERFTCKADAAKPGKRLGKAMLDIYANDEFKALVEKLSFTGLEFVWLQDKGTYPAPQWYWLNATNPLGRGLDHDYFDASKWKPHSCETPPEWRSGITWFTKSQLKDGVLFSSESKNLFVSLFSSSGTEELRFRAYRRYLKRFLPSTDFAFGREIRSPFFCFNRRVRDALLANNFVTVDECTPILTLESLPAGAELLDGSVYPLPRFSQWFEDDKLNQVRRVSAAAKQAFAISSKLKREATLEEVLGQLRDASRSNPNKFQPGASEAQLADANKALAEELPKAWSEILKVADGFSFEMGDPFDVVSSGSLAVYNRETQVGANAGSPNFPDRLIHITHGFSGDFHSLDLSSATPTGECKVIEFDHETLQASREWPSIALFVQEILRS